jgi:hypothetical protein
MHGTKTTSQQQRQPVGTQATAANAALPSANVPAPGYVPTAPGVHAIQTDDAVDEKALQTLTDSIAKFASADARFGEDFNKKYLAHLNSGKIPHTELGRDLLREPGVNDASHASTLRYSRLVDALNNKRFITPGWAGVRGTFANDGGRVGANDKPDYGQVYKMDGLETAESRAQKRAEGYEEKQKGREIERREGVKDQGPEFERLRQLAIIEQSRALNAEELRERGALYNAQIANRYNLPFEMMKERYATQLGMSMHEYQAQVQFVQMQYAMLLQRYIQYVARQEIPISNVIQAMQYNTGQAGEMLVAGMVSNALSVPNISPAQYAVAGYLVDKGTNAYENPQGAMRDFGVIQQMINNVGVEASNAAQKGVRNNRAGGR